MGGFGKNTCFSEEMQCPYEDSCHSLSHLCHGKGMCFPIHPNCYNVWTESFKTIPTDFLLSPKLSEIYNDKIAEAKEMYSGAEDKEAYDDAVRFLCSDSGYSLMEKTPTGQLQ